MQVVHNLEDFEPNWKQAALTLGVFDGIHLGHQALLGAVDKVAKKKNYAQVLVTYHPHPDLVLGKRNPGERSELFTYPEKLTLLEKTGLDAVIFLPFTKELARMTALRYLREILLGHLRAKCIVIGYDQKFGRGRKGNYALLKKMSHRYDYKVERVSAVKMKGAIVSSSRIRSLLAAGDVQMASRLLGQSFFLTGTVLKGHQRGKTLGFPTANLGISDSKIIPKEGVYSCIAEHDGIRYRAMVNVGRNPTFQQTDLSIEAHILGFDKDIYGELLQLSFVERLRDEKKFSGVDELIAQLHVDLKHTQKLRL